MSKTLILAFWMVTGGLPGATLWAGPDGSTQPMTPQPPPGQTPAQNTAMPTVSRTTPPSQSGGPPAPQLSEPGPMFACPPPKPGVKTPRGNCEWYDSDSPDPEHRQDVTYTKANETLRLLYSYQSHRLDELRGRVGQLQTPNDNSLNSEMPGFCEGGEPSKSCFERYQRYMVLHLTKIRLAMASNDDSAAKLLSKLKYAPGPGASGGGPEGGGDIPVVRLPAPEGPGAKQRPPEQIYLPSYKELQDAYADKTRKIQDQVSSGFISWVENESASPPKPEDFPLFKKVMRDPDNASAGFFLVLDRDKDGKPKLDDKLYKNALKAFGGTPESAKAIFANDSQTLKRMHLKTKDRKKNADVLKKTNVVPAKLVDQPDQISRDVFNHTRGRIVQDINGQSGPGSKSKALKIKGSSSSSAGTRTPAQGAQSPAPPPPNGYTGNEEIKKIAPGQKGLLLDVSDGEKGLKRDLLEQYQEIDPAVELPPAD